MTADAVDGAGRLSDDAEQSLPPDVEGSVSRFWHRRHALFSLYDWGVAIDTQGWYSVTPEPLARHIADSIAGHGFSFVLDLFGGVGGNAVAFASHDHIDFVMSVELDPGRAACIWRNLIIYGAHHKANVIVGNALSILPTALPHWHRISPEHRRCAFLAPPWGGQEYQARSLQSLDQVFSGLESLIRAILDSRCASCVYVLLPRNSRLGMVLSLLHQRFAVACEALSFENKLWCLLLSVAAAPRTLVPADRD